MHRTARTWSEFKRYWDGPTNFLMAGECVPFDFPTPPLDQVVDELRRDEGVSIHSGTRGDRLITDDHKAHFRSLPIEKALESSFGIAHYSLGRFDAPGRFLHGFEKRVLDPWRSAFGAQGFTFDRCYPIIFISGKGCATNYHMDFSHVIAWQVHGTKRFCGLKDPAQWTTREQRVTYNPARFARPDTLTEDDALPYLMKPGDVLWNALLTPHWVEASDSVAMSINLSHGGVRLHGKLAPFEQELDDHRKQSPDNAPKAFKGQY